MGPLCIDEQFDATQKTYKEENSTFSLCELDFAEGFTSIPNALIRDSSLTPNCRWLIIYLLSNRPDWVIKTKQIINHLKGNIGKDAFYNILNEAIEAGYIDRQTIKIRNLNRVKYQVSNKPRFKKCLRNPGMPDHGNHDPEKPDDKELLSNKNKQKKEIRAVAPSLSIRKKIKEEKKEVAPEVRITETQFNALLKKCNGDNNFAKKVINRLSDWKIGKEIKGGTNDYKAFGDWVIQAVISDEKKAKKTDQQSIQDRQFSERIWDKYKGRTDIHPGATYIEFVNGPHSPSTILTFGEKGFRERALEQLKKRKLDIIGL